MPSRPRILPSLFAALLVAAVVSQAASCALDQFGTDSLPPTTPCADDANCDDNDQCTKNVCGGNKVCEFKPVDGLAPEQKAGDCKQGSCQAGVLTQINDDADLPDDLESCTADGCNNGDKVHEPLADGSPCTIGDNAGFCKSGKCTVECGPQEPCNDNKPCTEDTCNASTGTCTFTPLDGLPTPGFAPVAGDCSQHICVSGEDTLIADDADLPPSDICKVGQCSMGTPSYTYQNAGAPCKPDGTGICNAAGICLECTTDADCPPLVGDNGCKVRTCTTNKCGDVFVVAGGVATTDKPGDCKKILCDGMGGPSVENDNNDVDDDGNLCTENTCVDGTPTTKNEASGKNCGGTKTCDGNGQCTGCTSDSDCGTSTDCITYTCISQNCKIDYVAAGTDTPNGQTSGDCEVLECDGAGKIIPAIDTSDVPNDSKECTFDTCSPEGTPSNPFRPLNDSCTENGGAACNGFGQCLHAPGDACINNTECASGFCIDGVCCADTCTGECMACNVPGSLGTCSNVPANVDDAPLCTGANSCDGMGVCKRDDGQGCGAASDCSSGFCSDGVCCNLACDDTCKSCNIAGSVGVCSFVANDTMDPTGSSPCTNPYRCDGKGSCKALNSVTCTLPSECLSGYCVDNYCCNLVCSETCKACSGALTGGNNGQCGFILNSKDPQDECPNGECNGAGMCTGGGGGNNLPNGSSCGNGAQCTSGFCVDGVCCNSTCMETCKTCNRSGNVGNCVDVPNSQQDPVATTPCTGAYRCDGAGLCKGLNSAPCTMPSQCLSGYCADGYCCGNICTQLCMACSLALNGVGNGTCKPIPAGTDPENECASGNCDGAGVCTP